MYHKHGKRKRRKTWRKLHIAFDPDSGEIMSSTLTTEHVADPTALSEELEDTAANVSSFLADGAYDGKSVYDLLAAKFGPDVEVIIPQPITTVEGTYESREACARAGCTSASPGTRSTTDARSRRKAAGCR